MLRCDVVASVQLLREEMDSLKFVEYGPCLSTLPTTDPPSALIPGLDEPCQLLYELYINQMVSLIVQNQI